MNVEATHKLSEQPKDSPADGKGWDEIAEILAVIALAVVAIATA